MTVFFHLLFSLASIIYNLPIPSLSLSLSNIIKLLIISKFFFFFLDKVQGKVVLHIIHNIFFKLLNTVCQFSTRLEEIEQTRGVKSSNKRHRFTNNYFPTLSPATAVVVVVVVIIIVSSGEAWHDWNQQLGPVNADSYEWSIDVIKHLGTLLVDIFTGVFFLLFTFHVWRYFYCPLASDQ